MLLEGSDQSVLRGGRGSAGLHATSLWAVGDVSDFGSRTDATSQVERDDSWSGSQDPKNWPRRSTAGIILSNMLLAPLPGQINQGGSVAHG